MTVDKERVAWVDYAKGFCIIMVVMMHSTLGVEEAAGAIKLDGSARRLRQAVPHARLLSHFGTVPRPLSLTGIGTIISTARSPISLIST
jgi:uncharacterized membrane protein